MNKEQYLQEIKLDILNLLSKDKLTNYKNQAFAWKLNATFTRTFEENYLWNRALFLSTNCCYLLQNNFEKKIAIKGLYESAEIYEYLSQLPKIDEKYDKDYLSILSALCYDLSGYQANAFCVADRIKEYTLETADNNINLINDNRIIEQIRLILLKKIPLAFYKLNNQPDENDIGYRLFVKSLQEWFNYLLMFNKADYLLSLEQTYSYYLHSGNSYLSHLIFLLETRILLFNERSIWNNLIGYESIKDSIQWKKYIKLLAFDYYSNNSIKEIQNRKSVFEFWTSQIRAIEKGLIALDENFVVQMPTSAGKTFIAELSILKYLIKYPGKKCIYVAPFRALTNEKEEELSKYFSKIGFSVSSLSGSYEIDEFQDILLSETDLLIATPEKIDLLLRLNPEFFNNVSFIVIDEGHIIGDISTRATLLEFLIIRLRIKLPELKTLFISAVMPPENANEYSVWLSGRESNVLRSLKFTDSVVTDEWEPTRKLISHFEWIGSRGVITFQNVITEEETTKVKQGAKLYSYLTDKEFGDTYLKKKEKKETAAALAYKLSEEGNTLVFCAQVRRIQSIAKALLSLLSVVEIPKRFRPSIEIKSAFYAKIWYGVDSLITKSINYGIGIHYGDMPEQVRMAVEDDFRNGLLPVLLSTNTIGQGLNFPIKNLIFYDTQIDYRNNKGIYIQFRDFWNIVGRAGRAGKETEGMIVFIVNSENDRDLFKKFTNKVNIEHADSLFLKVENLLLNNHSYTIENFNHDLFILSETYLLDMLSEEIIGTEYEDVINKIIDNSLFKVQLDKRNIPSVDIKNGFRRIFKLFEAEATFKQLSVYRITGFSFRSNKIINDFINENKTDLINIVTNDDFIALIRCFLILISDKELSELDDYKLKSLNITPSNYNIIIEEWIKGTTIQEIVTLWKNSIKKNEIDLHIFIARALYYLYPWCVSTFLIILAYELGIEYKELPENIKNLSSYIKFGLNNSTSCLARSLGIKSRQVSIFLYEYSQKLQGKEFIKWLSNLTKEEIDTFNLSFFDKENINDVTLKLTPNSFKNELTEFLFPIKGTFFNIEWSKKSKEVNLGGYLDYKRDINNKFDPYAILILIQDKPLGYIPKEYSKFIASEIDIESAEYEIIIINIKEKDKYNEIEVLMRKTG